eukprot:scaffold93999_cov39-Tisochrysis_lutea.AAC.2
MHTACSHVHVEREKTTSAHGQPNVLMRVESNPSGSDLGRTDARGLSTYAARRRIDTQARNESMHTANCASQGTNQCY